MSGSNPPKRASVPADRAQPSFSDLLPRAISGIVLIAAALGTAVAGGWTFALLWLAAALAIHWEWQRMIAGTRLRARYAIGSVALTAALIAALSGRLGLSLGILAVGAASNGIAADGERRLLCVSGVLYAGTMLVSVILLRVSPLYGLASILWLFAVVWGTDVMAYFGGRLIGGPKLWSRLSPSKTWSGFLVGVCCGALAGLAVAPVPGSYAAPLLLGLVTGAVSQGGDLFESALKRRFGLKDASHLIPGHGGVMDRLDGFLAAAVFAACFGALRFGFDAPGAGLFRW